MPPLSLYDSSDELGPLARSQGAYTGPLVNSEFMAALLAAVVFYVAFSTRATLQA